MLPILLGIIDDCFPETPLLLAAPPSPPEPAGIMKEPPLTPPPALLVLFPGDPGGGRGGGAFRGSTESGMAPHKPSFPGRIVTAIGDAAPVSGRRFHDSGMAPPSWLPCTKSWMVNW